MGAATRHRRRRHRHHTKTPPTNNTESANTHAHHTWARTRAHHSSSLPARTRERPTRSTLCGYIPHTYSYHTVACQSLAFYLPFEKDGVNKLKKSYPQERCEPGMTEDR